MVDIIYYAIPVFVISLVAEVLYYKYTKEDDAQFQLKDTTSSLTMGIGNVITGLVSKIVVFASLVLVYQYRIISLDASVWWYWILIFFADDFSYYWFHRCSHQIRYFWASHVVHHSSQYYNLGTALRQTWTGNITGSFVFYLWMPFLGFRPIDVFLMQTVSLIYQFFIHTEVIKVCPKWIEYVFNTPSHHRVHHGSDIKYLDKNHAGILIIWDRLFRTFKVEEERPTYGLTKNIVTNNPIQIALHEWFNMWLDVKKSPNIKTALRYIFNPPGWSHDGSSLTTKELNRKEKLQQ